MSLQLARIVVAQATIKGYVSYSYFGRLKNALLGRKGIEGDFLTFAVEFHKRLLEPREPICVLSQKEELLISEMLRVLRCTNSVNSFLRGSTNEQEVRMVINDLMVLMYLDAYKGKSGRDLKTTSCKSEAQVLQSCIKYGYFGQAWLYMQGKKLKDFSFWFIQKKEFNPSLWEIPVLDYPNELKDGRDQVLFLMETHKALV